MDLSAQNRALVEGIYPGKSRGAFGGEYLYRLLDAAREQGRADLETARELFEKALAVAKEADPQDAPFPMNTTQAAAYHRTRRDTLNWVLEMLPMKVQP